MMKVTCVTCAEKMRINNSRERACFSQHSPATVNPALHLWKAQQFQSGTFTRIPVKNQSTYSFSIAFNKLCISLLGRSQLCPYRGPNFLAITITTAFNSYFALTV